MTDRIVSKKDSTTYIYGLRDPRNDLIRYVGKANKPQKRLGKHLADSEAGTFAIHNWIRKLRQQGLAPDLVILERVPVSEWSQAERRWVEFYRAQNGPQCMLNMTDGGDCGPVKCGEKHPNAVLSEETVVAIRKDRAGGMTYTQLAEKHNIHRGNISRICVGRAWSQAAGPIEKANERAARRFTKTELRQMREMYATGDYAQWEVAKRFHTTQSRVSRYCRDVVHNLKGGRVASYRSHPQDGEANAVSKLTDDDVRAIRLAYSQGVWQKVLAARYGVSRSNIGFICQRKTWQHVSP